MVQGVVPGKLLVLGTEKVSVALFVDEVDINALIQKIFDHGGILSHNGHMQDVLASRKKRGEEYKHEIIIL